MFARIHIYIPWLMRRVAARWRRTIKADTHKHIPTSNHSHTRVWALQQHKAPCRQCFTNRVTQSPALRSSISALQAQRRLSSSSRVRSGASSIEIEGFEPTAGSLTATQFKPLSVLEDGQIRLFQILQGESQIEIVLLTGPLNAVKEKFEALSYAWESTDLNHEIICNGKPAMITASLFRALHQLRTDGQSGPLWADLICIHQEDVDEKTKQVRIMGDIFSSAQTVLIWLGPADQSTESALKLVRQIDEVPAFITSDLDFNGDLSLMDMLQTGLPVPDDPAWRALGSLYKRPWFSRAWILREIAEASASQVMVGDQRIDTTIVLRAMAKLYNISTLLPLILELDESKAISHYGMALYTFLSTADGIELPCLLWAARSFNCRDPRDKFFAIIDSSKYDKSLIDYGRSLQQVTVSTARHVLDSCESHIKTTEMLFLMLLLIDSRSATPGVPSWCPNYTYNQDFSPLILDMSSKAYEFRVDPPKLTFNTDESELQPRAMLCDPREMKPETQKWKLDAEDNLFLKGHLLDRVDASIAAPRLITNRSDLPSSDNHDAGTEYHQARIDFERSCLKLAFSALDETSMSESDKELSYIQCLTLGKKVLYGNAASTEQSLMMAYDSWIFGLEADLATHLHTHLEEPERLIKTVESCPEFRRRTGYTPGMRFEDLDRARLEVVGSALAESRPVDTGFYSSIAGRSFCRTLNNRIGWVPILAEPGDEICLFNGWPMPFALRKVGTEAQDGYRLLGACYIDGISWTTCDDEPRDIKIV